MTVPVIDILLAAAFAPSQQPASLLLARQEPNWICSVRSTGKAGYRSVVHDDPVEAVRMALMPREVAAPILDPRRGDELI